MKKTIELNTERLHLRPIRLSDAEAILKYRSDSVTNIYQGWIPKTIDDVIDFITNKVSLEINLSGSWYQLVIIKKDDLELIGDLGIHFLDKNNKQAELGCTLAKNHQGKGYAAEALNAVIIYLFNELDKHRIIASIDPENTKSISLFNRLGFRKEAHFKKSILINGKWTDDVIYAILKDEWIRK